MNKAVNYIQFETEDESRILVEIEGEEISPKQGVVKAGLSENIDSAVAVAQTSLKKALKTVVNHNAQALIQSVTDLPQPPSEIEITFGLKATGEVGNFAVAKAGGEANYTIKLVWKS